MRLLLAAGSAAVPGIHPLLDGFQSIELPPADRQRWQPIWFALISGNRSRAHAESTRELAAINRAGQQVFKCGLASGTFREKRPSTQAEYRRVLEALAAVHGPKPVRLMERRHIRRIRDERADTPGAANTIVRMLKLLLNFAVEDGLIAANPAAKMKLLKVGEWRAWTEEECAAFESRWPDGSMERRAYRLAVFSGQRKVT